jgi:hypothetical protein
MSFQGGFGSKPPVAGGFGAKPAAGGGFGGFGATKPAGFGAAAGAPKTFAAAGGGAFGAKPAGGLGTFGAAGALARPGAFGAGGVAGGGFGAAGGLGAGGQPGFANLSQTGQNAAHGHISSGPDARFRQYAQRFDFDLSSLEGHDHDPIPTTRIHHPMPGQQARQRLAANYYAVREQLFQEGKYFWESYPNGASNYRHIFYNPITRKECQQKNAAVFDRLTVTNHQVTYEQFEGTEYHTPNNFKPDEIDDRLWMQAVANKPPHNEYEFQLQQVIGFKKLQERVKQTEDRIGQFQDVLRNQIGAKISHMDNVHARHMQELQGNRHRQQDLMQNILRVMKKVELLHSHSSKLPWSSDEDEVASRLRTMAKQLENPAHPVNVIHQIGPRVRLATDTARVARSTTDSSSFALSEEDQRAMAEILQEQRKGLEFLRNILETDSRHMHLMMHRAKTTHQDPRAAQFHTLSIGDHQPLAGDALLGHPQAPNGFFGGAQNGF